MIAQPQTVLERSPLVSELLEYAMELANKHNSQLKLIQCSQLKETELAKESIEVSMVHNEKKRQLKVYYTSSKE